jgi:hypothetical protein
MNNYASRITHHALTLILLAVLLASCRPAPATVDPAPAMTQAFETALAQINQPTNTPAPTETPVPTATIPRTPPALPPVFTTGALNPLDTPHTYIQDPCQYLRDKWNPNNSAPGTIVMVIMLHGISKDETGLNPNDISVKDFKKMMNSLKELGFEAINAAQMADFMDHNAKIPPRSVLIIQDDRRTVENFETHFRDYYVQWGWPVVNAWISFDDSIRAANLEGNVALEKDGLVDHQSHGTIHNVNMTDASTDEFIRSEFEGSLNDLKTNFGKTPVAIIWPGGGFGVRPVQIAREYGYRLGFTTNPRGPVMFNWIPLADRADPQRPYFIAEGYVNDPRMVIPRYWPYQVVQNLDTVRVMGEQAAAYAQQNKAVELEYYDIVCAPTLGPIPAAVP